ncbi:hypothetical protein Cgig2_015523 [Carnegiea gigantea]|uniref:Uncharacterized protein n=1 Tax=Carnegiea gigantea TaxID=171969 RepID=A0A9Q1GIW3_9CARY|nr:hypothetical protein Cgig2_015523 [Carnegiea gigantea]
MQLKGGEGYHPLIDRIISWNVRGMNSPQKIFLQQQQAGMVGFLETKVKEKNMTHVVGKLCWSLLYMNKQDHLIKDRQGSVQYLMVQGLSDHSPISLDFPTCPMPRNAFHFFDMWVKDPQFMILVKQNLDKISHASKLYALKSLLYSLREPLNILNRSKENLIQVQSQLLNDPYNTDLLQLEKSNMQNYVSLNHFALSLIKQQSKAEWIGFYKNLLGKQESYRSHVNPQVIEFG